MRIDSLFVTHNGLTEPLGPSQIMPYVIGLARSGFRMEILSFEPAGADPAALRRVADELASEKVGWRPFTRSASHHLGRKVLEAGSAAATALARAVAGRARIVHARSHLPAAVADVVTTVIPGAKLLFDLRGMLGDEYVDAGHWTKDRLEYRLLKLEERRLFARSSAVVVLTNALQRWLREARALPEQTPIQVIPCCVNTERFRPDAEVRASARSELGLGGGLVVAYSGSLGSWYLHEEMARFVAHLRQRSPDLTWLVLSPSDPTALYEAADRFGFPRDRIVVRKVPPHRMPELLPAADLGLSFIKPCFSKIGSSPTKVAEYLQAGLVAVVNADIGDQRDLAVEVDACVVLPGFAEEELSVGAEAAVRAADRPYGVRSATTAAAARRHFALNEIAIPRYVRVYERLLSAGR